MWLLVSWLKLQVWMWLAAEQRPRTPFALFWRSKKEGGSLQNTPNSVMGVNPRLKPTCGLL